MKFLLSLLSIFVSLSASALSVGDKASYVISWEFDQFQSSEIKSITAQSVTLENIVQMRDGNFVKKSTIVPIKKINANLSSYSKCIDLGGQYIALTVTAGTFNVCHILQGKVHFFMSDKVPFGIVKMSYPHPDTQVPITMELTSFIIN